MRNAVGIVAPSYCVGEIEVDVDTIGDRKERLIRFDMPDIKDLWGWGNYRKTEKTHAGLACEAAAATLRASGLQASEIDGLVVCCGDAFNYYAQNQFLGEFSVRIGLPYTFTLWVGGAGCASLFSALNVAESLVLSETCRNVLVVSVDKIPDDAELLQRFGVLSDGACSFVVNQSARIDFLLRGVKVRSCPASLGNGGKDFQEKCQLIYSVFDELNRCSGFDYAKAGAYFGSNVFIPIQELELSVMPIDGQLAYQDNTARYGHCYAADPIINLVDFYANAANDGVRSTLMASSAHGHFGLVLLEKATTSPLRTAH